MAQYLTDFSEYTTGAQPSDWTMRYDADRTWEVQEDAGAEGGKLLNLASAVSPGLNGLSWDVIDSDAGRDDVEQLIKVRFPATTNTDIRTLARGAGTSSTIDAYAQGVRPDNTDQEIFMLSYSDGNVGAEGTWQPLTVALDTWYWIRTQVIGTDLRIRVWEDGTEEPETWDVETTDSLVTAAGWVGLHTGSPSEDEVDIDFYSAGTDGDAAPMPSAATDVTLEDSIEVNDEISAETIAAIINRTLEDSIDVADNVSVSRSLARMLADSLVIQDAIANMFEVALADAVTVEDVVDVVRNADRRLLDSLIVLDDAAIQLTAAEISRVLEDSISVDDNVTRSTSLARFLIESVNVDDSETAADTLSRILTDSLETDDKLVRAAEAFRSLLDAISVDDNVLAESHLSRLMRDAVDARDDKELESALDRFLFDIIELEDDIDVTRTIDTGAFFGIGILTAMEKREIITKIDNMKITTIER